MIEEETEMMKKELDNMTYVIGVDAGGTKTEVSSYDLAGEELFSLTLGAGNMTEDLEGAIGRIVAGIQEVKDQQPAEEECLFIVVGIAGLNVSTARDEEKIRRTLGNAFPEKMEITGDGELAHYAILKGRDGELVIAGTGSVINSRQGEKWRSYGGWGAILGDEGSGYALGLALLKNCLTEYDHQQAPSKVSQAVLKHVNCDKVTSLGTIVRDLSKSDIASITQILIDMPNDEAPIRQIIENEARTFANEYLKFYDLAYGTGPVTLGLNGGIIVNNELYRQTFIQTIEARDIEVTTYLPENKISKGAYFRYLEVK